ncbi:MAG: YXWGXW repeat-containing protein [Lentisphaerae bacterium]|nr:YXWGXW repeat-containing protein [Lentisphaerota bacterium]
MRQLASTCVCCGTIGILLGCASTPESHVVSAPPPPAPTRSVTTTTITSPADTLPAVIVGNPANGTTLTAVPAVTTTVVTQAPPAPQAEAVLVQPSPEYVWLAGYWTWRDNAYQWMAGHWEVPPSSDSKWVAPRWEQQGNAFRFYEGYWT